MNPFAVLVFFAHVCRVIRVDSFTLQIVHTNDMHARFDQVDEHTSACPPDFAANDGCYGGFARIRQAAVDIGREARAKGMPSIFLNAGDTFQGTPYYTVYKWNITATLVNRLEFDAMSLGNHEFDDGIDNLVQYVSHLKAPMVATNLNYSTEPRLNETNMKKSIKLKVDGIKIGIVAYLTPETMTLSETENLEILDEIPSVRDEARRLKSEGTKFIIALGHSGFKKDQEVGKEVEEIDLIVGAHSHTLLHTPKDKPPSTEKAEEVYPFWVTQNSGKKVPIVQASAFTKYIGKLIVTVDDDGNVIAAEGNTVLLDHTHAKNSEVEKEVETWKTTLGSRLMTVVGNTRVSLRKSNLHSTDLESNFANMITDALIEKSVYSAKQKNLDRWTNHAVAFFLNSGIRAEIDNTRNGGNLTVEDLLTAIPFQAPQMECTLSGSSLKNVLEISVKNYQPTRTKFDNFLHFSGLRVVYNLKKEPENRVKSVLVVCTECSIPRFETLDLNKSYSIILDSYILNRDKEYSVFGANCQNVRKLDSANLSTSDIVMEYIRRRQILYPKLDGRVQITNCGRK